MHSLIKTDKKNVYTIYTRYAQIYTKREIIKPVRSKLSLTCNTELWCKKKRKARLLLMTFLSPYM